VLVIAAGVATTHFAASSFGGAVPRESRQTVQMATMGVSFAAILIVSVLGLVIWTTYEVGARSIGPSPIVAFTMLFAIGMVGLWHCTRRLDDVHPAEKAIKGERPAKQAGSLSDFCVAGLPTLAAVGFAAAPLLGTHFDHDALLFANERQLVILGSDLSSGLAFFGVIVLGAFVMHYASVVFATTSHVVRRNLQLVNHLNIDKGDVSQAATDGSSPAAAAPLDTEASPPPAGAHLIADGSPPPKSADVRRPPNAHTSSDASSPFPAPDNGFSGSALLSSMSFSVSLVLLAAIGIEVWLGGMRIGVFGPLRLVRRVPGAMCDNNRIGFFVRHLLRRRPTYTNPCGLCPDEASSPKFL
jgi:hypothetical protein